MAYKAWKNSEIEKALREAKGMVYVAARQLGCHPDTIKARLKTSAQLRAALEAEDEFVTDTAELKLYQAIINGEPWAIQYRLSRKGKGRGYGEQKQEQAQAQQQAVTIIIQEGDKPIAFEEWLKTQEAEQRNGKH